MPLVNAFLVAVYAAGYRVTLHCLCSNYYCCSCCCTPCTLSPAHQELIVGHPLQAHDLWHGCEAIGLQVVIPYGPGGGQHAHQAQAAVVEQHATRLLNAPLENVVVCACVHVCCGARLCKECGKLHQHVLACTDSLQLSLVHRLDCCRMLSCQCSGLW